MRDTSLRFWSCESWVCMRRPNSNADDMADAAVKSSEAVSRRGGKSWTQCDPLGRRHRQKRRGRPTEPGLIQGLLLTGVGFKETMPLVVVFLRAVSPASYVGPNRAAGLPSQRLRTAPLGRPDATVFHLRDIT